VSLEYEITAADEWVVREAGLNARAADRVARLN
jgi:hypothetical protein